MLRGGSSNNAGNISGTFAKTRGVPVWVPRGHRGRSINGSAGNAAITVTGTAGVNTQVIGWSGVATSITALRVAYANFDLTATGEADRPSTEIWTTLKASVNVQQKFTTPLPFLWSGAASITLSAPNSPQPHGFILSDPLNVPIAANNSFGIRASAGIAATTTVNGADYINTVLGSNSDTRIVSGPATPGGTGITGFTEFDSRLGTAWQDQTGNTTNVSSSGAFYTLSPAIILSLEHPPAASLAIFGDSIMQGQMGYVADSFFNYGYIEQGLNNKIPWVNFSRGTLQAAEFNTMPLKYGVLSLVTGSQMYITDMIMGLGRNDCAAGNSAATIKADVANASLEFQQNGIPVHVQTIPPNTASQDAWATLDNQFYTVKSPTTTGIINSGATTFTVSSASGITNGMLLASQYGLGIAPGTTITISGTTVTLSIATTQSIASNTTMYFGSSTPNAYASTAIAYNAALLAGYNGANYNNNGFIYKSVLDLASIVGSVSGSDYKWVAGSITSDGIHPNQTGGTAVIAAGMMETSRYGQAT